MPSVGVDSKDHRPRRARREAEGQHHAGGPVQGGSGPAGLLSTRSVGAGMLLIFGVCGWQFTLLTASVGEPPVAREEVGQRTVNEALWRYLGIHEANLSALAYQQRDLAHLLAQLGEELARVARQAGAGSGVANETQRTNLEKLRATASDLPERVAAMVAQKPAAGPDAAGGVPQLLPAARKPGEWPAEWLEHFSREELEASAREAEKWRDGARKMFMHTWNGYKARAWGKDEMKPVSGTQGRTWANCGLQILDALSTMWIMELKEPFEESARWVEESLKFNYTGLVSFFEITIRALGGLVSAHSLSGRKIFLERAIELADKMMPAFSTQDPGFPSTQINLVTGKGGAGWFKGTILAEAGTVQLEFRYLSQQTGDPKYAKAADRSMRSILQAAKGRGLVPWGINRDGPPHFINTHFTFGALGDSYYEYLLKMYLQTAQTEPEWKDVWKKAMQEMQQRLITKTRGGLTYVAEEIAGKKKHKMDHLACFVGGMLVYGARVLPKTEVSEDWEPTAAGITETCYQMYHRQPSHLAPECVDMHPDAEGDKDMQVCQKAAHNLLRPEAAEAIFYMFYYTGDPKYRRMAGEIYEAIEAHARTDYGYSAVDDVRSPNPKLRNEMETFFLAETMKYLYLTFHPNPRDILDLNEFVLNTEAHPIRIFRGRKGGQGRDFLGRHS